MWEALVRDMFRQGLTVSEIKEAFQRKYHNQPGILSLVNDLIAKLDPATQKLEVVHSLCKYQKTINAQTMQNVGEGQQSNFSVPNSVGISGLTDEEQTSAGGYIDKLHVRKQVRDRKDETKKKEEKKEVEAAFTTPQSERPLSTPQATPAPGTPQQTPAQPAKPAAPVTQPPKSPQQPGQQPAQPGQAQQPAKPGQPQQPAQPQQQQQQQQQTQQKIQQTVKNIKDSLNKI